MFTNCPYCHALIATDPATDLPPERCPRCAAKLRELAADVAPPDATSPDVAEETGAGAVAESPAPQPIDTPAEVPPAPSVAMMPPAPGANAQVTTSTRVVAVPPSAVRPFASLLKPTAPGLAATTITATPSVATEPAASDVIETDATRDIEPVQPTPSVAIEPAPDTGTEKEPVGDAVAKAAADSDVAIVASGIEPAASPRPAAKGMPSFVRRGTATAVAMDWKLPAALAALALLLLLQLLLAERNRLAADARWRPAMSTLCGALHCTLPAWHEPAALALLDRDVRPHPDKPGVLRVTATFRNDARWPQPWPRLQLTLSDIDGNPVAAREFGARDYLGAAPTQAELRSGQSASIAMDIVEPAGRSVAFDFALH